MSGEGAKIVNSRWLPVPPSVRLGCVFLVPRAWFGVHNPYGIGESGEIPEDDIGNNAPILADNPI